MRNRKWAVYRDGRRGVEAFINASQDYGDRYRSKTQLLSYSSNFYAPLRGYVLYSKIQFVKRSNEIHIRVVLFKEID